MTDFLASMPSAYARAFSPSDITEHARIVARRGSQLAHAELCLIRSKAIVCVVADDRPGLLALVTDALLVHGLVIRSAQAFCRKRLDGQSEAVDFFELKQSNARSSGLGDSGGGLDVGDAELGAFLQTLTDLVAEDILASTRVSNAPVQSGIPCRVYFELEALRRDEYQLLVEAADSDGLLHAVTSALHAQGVRILSCEIGTEGGVARDRFELASPDGGKLSAERLCDVQQAVFTAVPVVRGSRH